jgi:hypothetical protein
LTFNIFDINFNHSSYSKYEKIKYILKIHDAINHIIVKIKSNSVFLIRRVVKIGVKSQIFGDGGSMLLFTPIQQKLRNRIMHILSP